MTIFVYFIFYLVCALNILLGIIKKKSNVIYAVAFIIVFVLMTFNYQGPDIEAYIITYKLLKTSSGLQDAFNLTYMDKGYVFLMFCGNKIGLDFFGFRVILTFVCLILFNSTIKFYKVNPNCIIGLYMVYLFFFDTIQLRNCIIQFIILFATRYLYQKSGLSILKYILCVLIAGSIHILALMYLPLLLIRFSNKKSFYQLLFGLAMAIFILCLLLKPVLPQILNIISKILNRGSGYFESNLRFSYLAVMALHMISLLPLYWYKGNILNKNIKKTIDIILKIEIILGLYLPFSFINSNFNRIFRNFLILDTIGLALLYENSSKNSRVTNNSFIAQFLLVGGWLITDMYRNRNEDIINAIMEYNLFFNYADIINFTQCLVVVIVCLFLMIVIKKVFLPKNKHRLKVMRCG